MSVWFEGNVTVNELRIHYQRTGGGKPTLILSHGTTDTNKTWSHIARELQPEYDVIMYDRRGHGLSDAPDSGYSFADHAVDLAGLIKTLDLKKPVIIGHSGGAASAAIVAADYPDLISGLILEDPPWGTGWGGWTPMTTGLMKYFESVTALTREELTVNTRKEYPGWTDEMVSNDVNGKLMVSDKVIQEFSQSEPDWRKTVSQISCPVLLITSDLERSAINTEQDIEEIKSLWQHGKALRIKGSSHMIHNDQPEAFLNAVKSFLGELSTGR